jgi:hypothetical protein
MTCLPSFLTLRGSASALTNCVGQTAYRFQPSVQKCNQRFQEPLLPSGVIAE